jgi:hypothetical protein
VKRPYLIIAILFLISLTNIKLYGQDCALINKNTLFAKGEIAILPDSILIFENDSTFGVRENYSMIEKVGETHYKIIYWMMELGGIVEPTIYKEDLVIKEVRGILKIKFGSLKANYSCQERIGNNSKTLTLTKINNR